jgi:hypothetical protein
MRTNQKDKEYFDSQIGERLEIIKEELQAIQNGEVAEDNLAPHKEFILNQILHLVIAQYSTGKPIETIVNDWQTLVMLLEDSWLDGDGKGGIQEYSLDRYVQGLWILVFGILLPCSDEIFQRIVNVVDRTPRKDWLLEYLISSRIKGRPQVDKLIFPKPYASLKKAVEETEPAKRSAIVKHYLEKEWYQGHKDTYWHTYHKSKFNVFFGYWSFEAAAVVKIAGIDDSSFRDNEYYPKDLL